MDMSPISMQTGREHSRDQLDGPEVTARPRWWSGHSVGNEGKGQLSRLAQPMVSQSKLRAVWGRRHRPEGRQV